MSTQKLTSKFKYIWDINKGEEYQELVKIFAEASIHYEDCVKPRNYIPRYIKKRLSFEIQDIILSYMMEGKLGVDLCGYPGCTNLVKQKNFNHERLIMSCKKEHWVNPIEGKSYQQIYGTSNPKCGFKKGEGNVAKRPEVRKKISKGVTKSYTPELRAKRARQFLNHSECRMNTKGKFQVTCYGYLYVFYSFALKAAKIGTSVNPEKNRIPPLLRAIGGDIIIMRKVWLHRHYEYERFLHAKYKDYNLPYDLIYGSEWFQGEMMSKILKDIDTIDPFSAQGYNNVFSFSIGHREHNSNNKKERWLHGHNITIIIEMIDEFILGKDIIENFVDDVLDHKMVLDINDPLHGEDSIWLLNDDGELDLDTCHKMPEGYWIPDMTQIVESMEKFGDIDTPQNKAILEKYEGTVLVDFLPTSENLANWLFEVISNRIKDIDNVTVNAIELWETEKSHVRVEA